MVLEFSSVPTKHRQRMPKLSETFAAKLPHAREGTDKFWDTEIKGLVLFVGKRTKTWYFQKDVGRQTRRVLIGRYPTISAAVARQTALGFALEMSRGAGKAIQMGAPTLEEALEAYLSRPKLRSEAHKEGTRAQFNLHLKGWMRVPLDEITRAMVVRRHQELLHIPSGANHVFKSFRAIYNYARRTYDMPECPTMAVEWYDEAPDVATITDLVDWRRTIDALPNPIHRVFYELLLFTGLRKTEALTLQWKHVHEDRIHLPMTKNGRSFDLPILQLHHEILAPVRSLSKLWVFPSPKSDGGYITRPVRLNYSPHMHRRTFATVAVEAGVLEEVVGRLLNHTPISITGRRYTRPSLDTLRPAMQTICDEMVSRLQ